MATLYISSARDKRNAAQIQAIIDDGRLPMPPRGTQKLNECDKCHASTVLRYYEPGAGWLCSDCNMDNTDDDSAVTAHNGAGRARLHDHV